MPERTPPVVQWDPAVPRWRAKVWSLVWELDTTCRVAWPTKDTCRRENGRWGSEDGKHETALSGSFTLTEIEKRSTNVRSSQRIFWVGLLRWETLKYVHCAMGSTPSEALSSVQEEELYLLKGLCISSSSKGDETQDPGVEGESRKQST